MGAAPEEGIPATDKALPFTTSEIYEHTTLQETAAAAGGVVGAIMEGNYRNCIPFDWRDRRVSKPSIERY